VGITLGKKPFYAEALAAQGGLDPVSDIYGLTDDYLVAAIRRRDSDTFESLLDFSSLALSTVLRTELLDGPHIIVGTNIVGRWLFPLQRCCEGRPAGQRSGSEAFAGIV
jgi:hypothetical protein